MNILHRMYFAACVLGTVFATSITQPLSDEVEPVMLRKLRWTMTMEEVRESLGHEIKTQITSDTTLVYEDVVFGAKAKIALTFGRGREWLTLASVDIKQPNEQVLEIISKHLHGRYGAPYDRKKKIEQLR